MREAARHVLALATWQRRRLEPHLRSTTDARAYRRTMALPEAGGGDAVAAAAARLRVAARLIYRGARIFARSHDPAARPGPRPPGPAPPADGPRA